MKLLTKTSLYFLTIALVLLFLGGIGSYYAFKRMVNRDVEKELMINMHHLIMSIANNNIVPNLHHRMPLQIGYEISVIPKVVNHTFILRDSLVYDTFMDRYQEYKIIKFQTEINDRAYQFSISKSLSISDGLIEKVALSVFFLSLIFLLCFSLFNRYFLSKIWSNFFQTIDTMQTYDLSSSADLEFPETEIYEFGLLNSVLMKMVERIKLDFINLKEFNENISHEIQTPLAIIKTKIDLLMQHENLDEQQVNLIQSINTSTNRLSNLSKSLHLLAKIDNNQFPSTEDVDINALIELHLNNFEDIIEEKKISVNWSHSANMTVVADSNLTNIMILNLLKNSVRHNHPEGRIDITLDDKRLVIGNTTAENDIHADGLFKRFSKKEGKTDSLGLGLAIIKRICDYYHFEIQFSFKDRYISISILFNK